MAIKSNFFIADLHIHSFGEFGSFDVYDPKMTPEAIVDAAISCSIDVISITDHNQILNSKRALNYSKDKEIFVIPGIELSTPEGHLLAYFENFENLNDFYGTLSFSSDKKFCNEGIVQCLSLAAQFNGIGILAHIELDCGFESTLASYGQQIEEIVTHTNLRGLEITSNNSLHHYTSFDQSANRKKLINLRRERLGFDENYNLPKLMSSDAHSLDQFIMNANTEKKLIKILMDDFSFNSFRLSLADREQRIYLNI